MPQSVQWSTKEVDVDFLVFIERHATDLLRLDILTLWGKHPQFEATVADVAQQLGRSSQAIRPELGDLALTEILIQTETADGQIVYRLSQDPQISGMVKKLAGSQFSVSMSDLEDLGSTSR